MIKKESKNVSRLKRHARIRKNLSGTSTTPRLNIFRSNTNIYAQIIDDEKGVTLVSASSLDMKLNGSNIENAKKRRNVKVKNHPQRNNIPKRISIFFRKLF